MRVLFHRTTSSYQIVFLEKLCSFFNHGISGVLGKLMHYAAKGLMVTVNADGSDSSVCVSTGCRISVFATISTIFAVLILALVAYLPGDVDFISLERVKDGTGHVSSGIDGTALDLDVLVKPKRRSGGSSSSSSSSSPTDAAVESNPKRPVAMTFDQKKKKLKQLNKMVV
jgi:hypothetical protein